jgi:hypothetical protein
VPSNFQQQVKQSMPYAIEEATVVSYDPRDPRSLAIRTNGGRVIKNCTGATSGLTSGVHVLIVINRFGNGAVVIGAIQDAQTMASTGSVVQALNPPGDLSIVSGVRLLVAQWSAHPSNNGLCYQVQHNAIDEEDGNEVSVLITRGSQYVHDCPSGTTRYFRLRVLQYISASNIMYSAWSVWASGTSIGVSASDISLEQGKVLIGGVDGFSAEQAVSGDASITYAGVVTLKNTGPGTAGPIGDSTNIPVISIDAQGRVTALTSVPVPASEVHSEVVMEPGILPPTPVFTADDTDWIYALVE